MKNLLKTLFKNALPVMMIAMALSGTVQATTKDAKPDEKQNTNTRIAELDNLDFIEMLNSVDVGQTSALIQKFQTKEGKTRLLNGKFNPKGECTVEAYRNKEVLLVTIPAHLLFGPNMTELKHGAEEYLSPIRRYLKDPDMYRVMIVMLTDNTGSEPYREQVTVDRVNAVFDWFDNSVSDTRYLFSYALSDDMPLRPNDSMENRDRNRRLEIYLVPGQKMVNQAKKGRISF